MELYNCSLEELGRLFARGEVSALAITRSVLDRIAELDAQVGAYLEVDENGALAQAEAADQRRRNGEKISPLCGMPLGLKDLLSTKGMKTTCASRMLADYRPEFDATVVTRLREAGAVLLGKLNMDEFAMGSSTENSAFHPTRNPWNLGRVPGGSSGGSTAAVAAGMAIASLGSDTGGSIRQPASFCGVVGLKPSYGRVSRYGLVAFASSLDQIGPITATVADAALLLGVIAGFDAFDSTSVKAPVPDYYQGLDREIEGLRIGVPREYFAAGLDPEVEAAVNQACRQLGSLGARLDEVSLPHTDYAVATYYLLATAEASSNLARYDGVKYGFRDTQAESLIEMYRRTRAQGFGEEVKRRIMLGTYALSAGYYDAYYRKAQQVRTLITQDFDQVFRDFDVIVAPVCPTPAFAFGEKVDDPLAMYLSDILTIPVNLAGLPAISVPCGLTAQGLPVGLQLIARPFAEEMLLRVARHYEQVSGWNGCRPQLQGNKGKAVR
ncbi:MAG TPA: Asp-tRNA(Asn)/Glu-tRNA(Gln) amidotransferase subunit GatA [Proteobacteria bacterium]|nr:Asp-tRNA(Asn)/Glu-tRNA(Gln) amidotransferase subunit GatA [Pseudomonadota bacterium]